MTVREGLHKLVDDLRDEELVEVQCFIEGLRSETADNETLTPETLAAIEEGLQDIKAGRTISLQELEREHGL